jgi:hypothetical protein
MRVASEGHWKCVVSTGEAQLEKRHVFFVGYQGGGLPPAGQTQESVEPDCWGPEAKPHQRDTPRYRKHMRIDANIPSVTKNATH